MKVGLIVPGFSADSADWCIPVLVDAVRELSRQADVHVFALRYPYARRDYRLHGAHIHALGGGAERGMRRGVMLVGALASVLAEHRRGGFDVLHGLWADEAGFVAAVAGRLLGVPAVVSVMGGELVGLADIGYGGQLVLTNRALTAFSLRASNCITIASSRGIVRLEAMLGTRSSHRLVRLVWGVDPTLVASIDPPLPLRGGFRLVHVGSLIPVKDQTMLLHAFRRVRAVQKDAHLHIVGGGPLRQSLESLAASLGLDESISFHGPVRREDLAGYYRACHALVVSSRHEMQPVVALEAALCRLPIVGCDIGLVSDLAPHAALAVPVGDDAAMSDALLSLVSEQPRLTLGAAAHDWVRSSCLASHTANQLMALYRDVRRTARESRAGLLRQDHTHETGVSLGEPAGD